MTRHISEDTLLQFALGLLNTRSANKVSAHIKKCAECRGLKDDVDRTIEQLKSVTPEVDADTLTLSPLNPRHLMWLRAAAMLAIGFGLGFLASESFRAPSISVVRQQIDPRPRVLPTAGFVVCDEVDLSPGPH